MNKSEFLEITCDLKGEHMGKIVIQGVLLVLVLLLICYFSDNQHE